MDVNPVNLGTRQQDDACSCVRQKGDPCTNCLYWYLLHNYSTPAPKIVLVLLFCRPTHLTATSARSFS